MLRAQGRLLALGLGQRAVARDGESDVDLVPGAVDEFIRRLAEPAGARVRVFDHDGTLVADSRQTRAPGGAIHMEPLAAPGEDIGIAAWLDDLYEAIFVRIGTHHQLERHVERPDVRAPDYAEVAGALLGDLGHALRVDQHGQLILSVAGPIQNYRRVVGALQMSTDGRQIDQAMRRVRTDILRIFAGSLAVTVLLSLYLAGTIARPIRRLALAAEQVRHGRGRDVQMPNWRKRGDEIGDLSEALGEMTDALRRRIDSNERFAADVAHEIKNPLTSVRSAVETLTRLRDPERQSQLLAIVLDDVQRLDRLINDISDASRLDAELSRAQAEPIDLDRMLVALLDMERGPAQPDQPRLAFEKASGGPFVVQGLEGRLVQVFRNLLVNAQSFSPPGGKITVRLGRQGDMIRVAVEDEGIGIPAGKEAAIFERFYSERPEGEKFGTHSGLGLSISHQIVGAHAGSIHAENRLGPAGERLGARFVVLLPARARP